MNRIFVVEGETAINRLICMSLTAAAYETVPAYDGQEALELLRSREKFHRALLDLTPPGLDGFELLPRMKKRKIPVIYLTAKSDIQSKVQGLTSAAEDYIVKPAGKRWFYILGKAEQG